MDPAQPAALMEELVEEVLVRIPPDDPASLVCAALVCKRWCRLISGASFRRRFRELHPAPPKLGFLYQRYSGVDFVPASSFRSPHAFRDNWRMLDARHGRVLVMDMESFSFTQTEFIVWDTVTDRLQKLPILEFRPVVWSAALLCATVGCDHLDCRRGAFIAVVIVTDERVERYTSAYAYSSEQGAWSEPITVQHHNDCILRLHRALVGNALYFNYELNTKILEYDLGRRELSVINLPSEFRRWHIVLMEAEDSRLGFATIQESKLSVWSRESGLDGYAGWAQQRVIELDKLQPVSDCNLPVRTYVLAIAHPPYVVAVTDSVNVIFVWTDDGLFTIDLKSSQFKRIGEYISNFGVVPYMSFCTPALSVASMGDERPTTDASSA
ncbi:unnamed protein product [Urochloa decumbens]|uniref:F-box domain-containing protein n=1 Tax=Urochloa decumbens TaxID=240449 RepID=A0ABC8VDJ5_9POAL